MTLIRGDRAEYENLAEAIADARPGETIILVDDSRIDEITTQMLEAAHGFAIRSLSLQKILESVGER